MVELVLLAALSFGPTEHCTVDDFSYGCSNGVLSDDGAVLDGSTFDGGEGGNQVTVDGDGSDRPKLHYCGRRDKLCDLDRARPDVAVPGTLTLSDIAAFRAEPGSIATEPSGWAVVGLPLNAVSTASVHTVDGVLLGGPATVRFTPVAWRWDFGDGSDPVSTPSGGATWSTLGAAEFDATPTSHVYRDRGGFTVRLVVTFVADYRLGSGGWIRIPGSLDLPTGAPATIRAVMARTMLVDEDCEENPRGPGC